MSITLGDAVLWIRGNSEKLPGDLKKTEGEVKSWSARIGESMKGAIGVAAGQLMAQGMEQLSSAIQDVAKDIVDTSTIYIREVEEMARATGSTVEDASRLIQVADDQRVSVEALGMAVKTYSQKMAAAGMNTTITVDEIARLSDEYLRLAPGTERNAFLLDKFGRSGMEMARLMEQGGDAIKGMAEEVDESLIITQEAIDANREYEMAMDDLEDSMTGVKLEIGKALLPILKDLVVILKDNIIPAVKWLAEGFGNLPTPIQWLIVAVGLLVVALAKLGPAIIGIAGIVNMFAGAGGLAGLAGAASSAGTALAGLGGTIMAVLTAPITLLIAAIGLLVYVIINLGPTAWTALEQLDYIVKFYLMQILQYFVNMAASASKAVIDMWKRIVDTAKSMANNVKQWFRTVGSNIISGIWEGIQAGWDWLITQVENLAQSLLDAATNALGIESPSKAFAVQVGAPIAQGIGVGFEAGMVDATANMQAILGALPEQMRGAARISVGRIEYHGAFSRDELRRLDRRNKRIAGNAIREVLG